MIDPLFRAAVDEAGGWLRLAGQTASLALFLLVLVAALCGLAVVGWGAVA